MGLLPQPSDVIVTSKDEIEWEGRWESTVESISERSLGFVGLGGVKRSLIVVAGIGSSRREERVDKKGGRGRKGLERRGDGEIESVTIQDC